MIEYSDLSLLYRDLEHADAGKSAPDEERKGLSFPKIICVRSDDAIRIRLVS